MTNSLVSVAFRRRSYQPPLKIVRRSFQSYELPLSHTNPTQAHHLMANVTVGPSFPSSISRKKRFLNRYHSLNFMTLLLCLRRRY